MLHPQFLSFTSRLYMIKNVKLNAKYLRNSNNFTKVYCRNNSSNAPKQKTASSVYRTMNVFDRKVKILQRERSAQRDDYHLAEYIKEEVGWRTADRILDVKRVFKNAVELGKCSTMPSLFSLCSQLQHLVISMFGSSVFG